MIQNAKIKTFTFNLKNYILKNQILLFQNHILVVPQEAIVTVTIKEGEEIFFLDFQIDVFYYKN